MEYILARRQIPIDIVKFMNKVFEIYEIRGRVGFENGIEFIVHSNEQNHSIPHIHAKYGKYEVSIEILSGKVLVGNIPKKNQKRAIEWVLSHQEKLLNDWNNLSISAVSTLTQSNLSLN